ncbi:tetratricopeptide repeat protein [bacterium]|nr:tetratricopeptide repeat protein [FCB group bacterium]MBL7190830.1 tetratricopeptide repeat protein [bacterium]
MRILKYIFLSFFILIFAVNCAAGVESGDIKKAKEFFFIGDSLLQSGDYESARKILHEALLLKYETGDTLGGALCQLRLGKIAFQQNYYSKALRYFEEALTPLENAGLYRELSELYNHRGRIFGKHGQWEEAVLSYRRAIELAERIPDSKLIFINQSALGSLSLQRMRLDGALNNFRLALQLAPELIDSVTAYCKIAETYALNQEFNQALTVLDSALTIVIGDTLSLIKIYGARGKINYQRGDYPGALLYYQKQLDYIQSSDDAYGRARVMMNMAVIYEQQGNIAKASDFMEEVVKIFRRVDSSEADKAQDYLNKLQNR